MQKRKNEELITTLKDYLEIYYEEQTGESLKFKQQCVSKHHNDSTPSMIYYENPTPKLVCMGCGRKWDIFDLAKELEGLEFNEALLTLAYRYGLQDMFETKQTDPKMVKNVFNHIMKFALSFNPDYISNNVNTYLKQKNINIKTLKSNNVGYISKPEILFKSLEKVYSKDVLEELGVYVKDRLGNSLMFGSDYLIFGIQDLNGDNIALSSRYCGTNEHVPKYRNSPNNILYNKNDFPYGMQNIRNNNDKILYIVEGQTDYLALNNIGISSIALTGTNLSENTLNIISEYNDKIVLALDNDYAGINSMNKIIKRFIDNKYYDKYNVELEVLQLDDKLDIDEYINTHGLDRFFSQTVENDFVFYSKNNIANLISMIEFSAKYFSAKQTFEFESTFDKVFKGLQKKYKTLNYYNYYNFLRQSLIKENFVQNLEDYMKMKKQLNRMEKNLNNISKYISLNEITADQCYEKKNNS
jgi:DNA primase catalytic core